MIASYPPFSSRSSIVRTPSPSADISTTGSPAKTRILNWMFFPRSDSAENGRVIRLFFIRYLCLCSTYDPRITGISLSAPRCSTSLVINFKTGLVMSSGVKSSYCISLRDTARRARSSTSSTLNTTLPKNPIRDSLITKPVLAIEIQQFSPVSISTRDQQPNAPLSMYRTRVAIDMSDRNFQTNKIHSYPPSR